MLETDKAFAGSIPENYDRHMVPLIFEPYAADLAQRAASLSPRRRFGNRRGHRGRHPRIGAQTVPRRKLHRNRPQPADARLRRFAASARRVASNGARRMLWRCRLKTRPSISFVASSARCSSPTVHLHTAKQSGS